MPIICISKGVKVQQSNNAFRIISLNCHLAIVPAGWSMNMCYVDIYVFSFLRVYIWSFLLWRKALLNEWYSPTKNFEYLQIVFLR